MDIPSPGLGTFRNTDPEQCAESVQNALSIGYRHIDTAKRYDNEEAVGRGISASNVPRDDVFVATKVLHAREADSAEPDAVTASAKGCLDRLGVDTLDLLYIHWPDKFDLDDAFGAFADLYAAGVMRSVGVCNFTIELLEAAQERFTPIVANQVEMHPLLQQADLRGYCAQNDITVVAYAPLIQGKAAEVPELRAVADKHGITPSQVSLAWVQAKGAIPIPKATGEPHLRENWAAREIELPQDDIEKIDSIDREQRLVDPSHAPW